MAQEKNMNELYFVIGQDEDGTLVFITHGYFKTRKAAESYARTVAPARNPQVLMATSEFYEKGLGACGS